MFCSCNLLLPRGCSSGRTTNGALPNAMPQAVPCFSFVSASCDGAVNENVQTRNLLEPNCIGRLLSVGYGPALCCSSHSWLTSVCVDNPYYGASQLIVDSISHMLLPQSSRTFHFPGGVPGVPSLFHSHLQGRRPDLAIRTAS